MCLHLNIHRMNLLKQCFDSYCFNLDNTTYFLVLFQMVWENPTAALDCMREQLLTTELSESIDAPDRLSEMQPNEENAIGDFLFWKKILQRLMHIKIYIALNQFYIHLGGNRQQKKNIGICEVQCIDIPQNLLLCIVIDMNTKYLVFKLGAN